MMALSLEIHFKPIYWKITVDWDRVLVTSHSKRTRSKDEDNGDEDAQMDEWAR